MSLPILSRLAAVFDRKSVILASIMMLAVGSLVCESADTLALLLAGRVVQGFGAGGLTVLSYALYGDLQPRDGLKFLTAMSLFIAAGTVCGPLIGAVLSHGHRWVRLRGRSKNHGLTAVQALDLSLEHSFVPSARGARVQRGRCRKAGLPCREALRHKPYRCCTAHLLDRPSTCRPEPCG